MQIHTLSAALAVLGTAFLLVSPQSPKPEEPVVTLPAGTQKEVDRIQKEMQGLWKLSAMDWPLLRGASTDQVAYCLVSGNVMSMEFHVIIKGPDQRTEQTMFDSGFWSFEIGDANRLLLKSMIGSYLRPEDPNVLWSPFVGKANRLEFRAPGSTHRYDIQLVGDKMILTHDKGQKLTFTRMPTDGPLKRDAYGRVIQDKKKQ